MKPDAPISPEFFTETQKSIVQTDAYDLDQRLWWITDWLKEAGITPEALMLGYFNECMRVATESRGVMGSYIMANQLHWHVVQLIRKLNTAAQAVMLPELPRDPTDKNSSE